MHTKLVKNDKKLEQLKSTHKEEALGLLPFWVAADKIFDWNLHISLYIFFFTIHGQGASPDWKSAFLKNTFLLFAFATICLHLRVYLHLNSPSLVEKHVIKKMPPEQALLACVCVYFGAASNLSYYLIEQH